MASLLTLTEFNVYHTVATLRTIVARSQAYPEKPATNCVDPLLPGITVLLYCPTNAGSWSLPSTKTIAMPTLNIAFVI